MRSRIQASSATSRSANLFQSVFFASLVADVSQVFEMFLEFHSKHLAQLGFITRCHVKANLKEVSFV